MFDKKFITSLSIIVGVIVVAGIAVVLGIPNQPESTGRMVVDNKDDTNGNGEVSSPPEIITSDIDTSDWLTYRNEELGFEFRYPNSYIVKEQSNLENYSANIEKLIFFYDKKYLNHDTEFPGINYFIYDNNKKLSLKEWISSNGNNILTWNIYDYKQTVGIIHGYESLILENKSVNDKILLIKLNDKIVIFTTVFPNNETKTNFEGVIKSIKIL